MLAYILINTGSQSQTGAAENWSCYFTYLFICLFVRRSIVLYSYDINMASYEANHISQRRKK